MHTSVRLSLRLGYPLLFLLVAAGCAREAEEFGAPRSDGSFSIDATNTVVEAEALPAADSAVRMVWADFNLDSHPDVAVEETDTEGRSVVAVYLRKPPGDDLREQYYRAGGIREKGDYRISALMSSAADGHTDLIAILEFDPGRKEMIHYRSTGHEFNEVLRKTIADGAGGTAAP